jgi:hypothetical protein
MSGSANFDICGMIHEEEYIKAKMASLWPRGPAHHTVNKQHSPRVAFIAFPRMQEPHGLSLTELGEAQ